MSWEEMSTSQTVCPCGRGYSTQNGWANKQDFDAHKIWSK